MHFITFVFHWYPKNTMFSYYFTFSENISFYVCRFRLILILSYLPGAAVALGGLVVSVLATGPKVCGFKPGRGRWMLKVIKSAARLPSEGK
jgi:hypothetical protein